ncbi:hypothetical protein FJ251_00640 [bacterium]|nr:hypothetical protein [bacterium]
MMMTTDPARLALRLLALGVLVSSLSLVGCGQKKIENPYEPASLTQAVSGENTNKLFKFELSSPKVLAVGSKLALLAEGDRLEFLCADDLSLLGSVDASFKLGVRRQWGSSPDVFLILEHVIEGADTSFVTADEPPVFPSYQNFASFDRTAYVDLLGDIGRLGESDQRSMLRAYGQQGEKVWVTGELGRNDLGGILSYTLDTAIGRFKLEGVNSLGELFLKAAMSEGGQIGIGGPLGESYRRSQQDELGVLGPLTLEVFRFQNYMITNG